MYINYYKKFNRKPNATAEELVKDTFGFIQTIERPQEDCGEKLVELFTKTVEFFMPILPEWNNKDTSKMYETFRIPKASGGYREICAPVPELKQVQRDIAKHITRTLKYLPHNRVHSYTSNRNCKSALYMHQARKAEYFLKVDIKDFFGSITREMVVAQCRKTMSTNAIGNIVEVNDTVASLLFLNGSLPQGAPTSPVLSNAIMQDFDARFNRWCWDRGLCYTRYADDILVSKSKPFEYKEVIDAIKARLPVGLELNDAKTKYKSCRGANWMLGLMYNKDLDVTVGATQKHVIQCAYHNLYRDHPEDFDSKLAELKGLLNYYYYIEPEYFGRIRKKLEAKGYDVGGKKNG